MSALNGKRLLSVATAAVVPSLVVAACAIQLRGDDENTSMASPASRAAVPLAAELERCRTVTSEQVAELQECRRVWTENRRRFLGRAKAPAASSVDAQPGIPPPSLAQPKDPGRVLWDGPPFATPKGE
jgi:conjugative transfer region protein TrbK